jgi:hypothetical protein
LVNRNAYLAADTSQREPPDPSPPANPGRSGAAGRFRRTVLPSALATPRSGPLASGRSNGRPSQAVDPAQDRGEQGARHRHLGQLEDQYRPWRTIRAPIFTSFSRRVKSDHRATSSGSARLRQEVGQVEPASAERTPG